MALSGLGVVQYTADMTRSDDLGETIADAAASPAEGHDDAGGFTAHNLRDQIEADKYLARKAAAARSGLPFRLGKFRPGGTV